MERDHTSPSLTLQSAGVRVTPQRLAVFEELRESGEHLSAEALFRRVKERQPSLSLATVYRTLDMLREAGLIVEGRLGDERNFYEANVEPHFHLICLNCHEVRDLSPEGAEALHREAEANSGYRIHWSRLEFFGTCEACQARQPEMARA
jgi:Fur family peroxide stress response transcriptional regulator